MRRSRRRSRRKSDRRSVFDFSSTGTQVLGNHNAPPAVTYSAVIYSVRSLVGQDIPLNQGWLAPIKFIIPKYSLLNPSSSVVVVGGNVLTSQPSLQCRSRHSRATLLNLADGYLFPAIFKTSVLGGIPKAVGDGGNK
jgi:N-methylhydantoinase B/oxoprolinase/acetone carboxylase alpha subunit